MRLGQKSNLLLIQVYFHYMTALKLTIHKPAITQLPVKTITVTHCVREDISED